MLLSLFDLHVTLNSMCALFNTIFSLSLSIPLHTYYLVSFLFSRVLRSDQNLSLVCFIYFLNRDFFLFIWVEKQMNYSKEKDKKIKDVYFKYLYRYNMCKGKANISDVYKM